MRNDTLNDKTRLLHILEAISEIESYIITVDHSTFLDSSLVRNATLMQIQVIGEAVSHLSESLKSQSPEAEWRQIRSTRNIIAHQYFGIDFEIVWDIASVKLPIFKNQVQHILATSFNEPF
ncbi:MAG: DUF86 domain-containing protein [Sphingobacteriaceae bacterium]|nr:DUF86 domain-containing protein [Sphingobacteriaceae bacterium]